MVERFCNFTSIIIQMTERPICQYFFESYYMKNDFRTKINIIFPTKISYFSLVVGIKERQNVSQTFRLRKKFRNRFSQSYL